jgi:hypothetical protein
LHDRANSDLVTFFRSPAAPDSSNFLAAGIAAGTPRGGSYPGGRPGVATRDRRRIRRSSASEARTRQRKPFFALADQLVQSSDPAGQKRLKEELARLTFDEKGD